MRPSGQAHAPTSGRDVTRQRTPPSGSRRAPARSTRRRRSWSVDEATSSVGDGPRQPAPAAMSTSRALPTGITPPRATGVPASPSRKSRGRAPACCRLHGRMLARWAAGQGNWPVALALAGGHDGAMRTRTSVRDFRSQREASTMKRALMTPAPVPALAGAMPALAGYPIAWFDERYPLSTNQAHNAFPNPLPGDTAAAHAKQQPYALTGTQRTAPEGWKMSVEWIGRYPQTIYKR